MDFEWPGDDDNFHRFIRLCLKLLTEVPPIQQIAYFTTDLSRFKIRNQLAVTMAVNAISVLLTYEVEISLINGQGLASLSALGLMSTPPYMRPDNREANRICLAYMDFALKRDTLKELVHPTSANPRSGPQPPSWRHLNKRSQTCTDS